VGFALVYPCCQQNWLPTLAFRLHCVPFLVVAWQRVDSAALETGGVLGFGDPARTGSARPKPRIGGRQTLHGPNLLLALGSSSP
jgi:hypothetical protein